MRSHLPILMLAASLAGCQTIDERPSERFGTATLARADGSPVGTARLIGSGGRVDVTVALNGLPPGRHRLRLHRIGECAAPGYTAVGEHLAGIGVLPDAIINASGSGTVSTALAGEGQDLLSNIFDADGTAIILHQGADGPAHACGVFTRD